MLQLVKRAMRSDKEAFIELMDRNTLAMYKVARGILKNDEDAADAIQDTILTCFEKISTLRKPEFFKTWMTRILINKCNEILAHYRGLDNHEEIPEIPHQDLSMAEFEFHEMLNKVDEKYRVILILYYVEGFKISEVAQLLELNENTVKTRLKRAREQLRDEYQDMSAGRSSQPKAVFSNGGMKNEKRDRFQFKGRITAG